MATRTPLQPTETLRASHEVGCHTYMVRYPKGQEDRARECIARWVRNKDLAFSWADASAMGEQLPDTPLQCSDGCACNECVIRSLQDENERIQDELVDIWWNLETAKSLLGFSFVAIAVLIWRPWA